MLSRLLSHVLELLLEFLSSKKYTALHRAERDSKSLGYFIVFISAHVHGEWLLESLIQRCNGRRYLFDGHSAIGRILSSLIQERYIVRIAVGIDNRL